MSINSTRLRYGSVAQAFHWLTVLLVGAGYLLGKEGGAAFAPENATRLTFHESIGVAVLVVVVARLAWRLFDGRPDGPPVPAWMSLVSRIVHWLLYALLFALPFTAIIGSSLRGRPIFLLGIGGIGPFTGSWRAAGSALLDLHVLLGTWIVWIAAFHAAAALFHHFFLKNRVLLAMLPGTRN